MRNSMNVYSKNDISKKTYTIPAQAIIQPVWVTLNPHHTLGKSARVRGEIREVNKTPSHLTEKLTGREE